LALKLSPVFIPSFTLHPLFHSLSWYYLSHFSISEYFGRRLPFTFSLLLDRSSVKYHTLLGTLHVFDLIMAKTKNTVRPKNKARRTIWPQWPQLRVFKLLRVVEESKGYPDQWSYVATKMKVDSVECR
jgi:hypothetical protein